MGTRSYIALQIEEDEYLTIFCHYNGYPDDNGAILAEHYDKQEKVESLIQLGDLYFLRSKLEPNPDLPHNHSTPQPNVTIAYNRDEGWSDCEAVHKTLDELSVMRACIGSNRAPDGRYAEIDLPASPYRLLNALDEIGIKSTKEIVYQEILNYGSFGYLEPHFDEYTMLEELNALAQKLAVFDRVDSIAFEGLVKMAEQKPEPFGVKELINFAHSTESCHVVSDVFDDEQLGRFYAGNGFMPEYETLPDKIYEHLDFAKIGREARESEGGVFTQRG